MDRITDGAKNSGATIVRALRLNANCAGCGRSAKAHAHGRSRKRTDRFGWERGTANRLKNTSCRVLGFMLGSGIRLRKPGHRSRGEKGKRLKMEVHANEDQQESGGYHEKRGT